MLLNFRRKRTEFNHTGINLNQPQGYTLRLTYYAPVEARINIS